MNLVHSIILISFAVSGAAQEDKPRAMHPEYGEINNSTKCDPDDWMCQMVAEFNADWPAVSLEDIKSDDWESTLRALHLTKKIRVVGKHHSKSKNLPEGGVQKAFEEISALPHLQHLNVEPNAKATSKGGATQHTVSANSVSWLLSKARKVETLELKDLQINDQDDVIALAKAIVNCEKLSDFGIEGMFIAGGKDAIKSLDPLFKAITKLDNMKSIHIELKSSPSVDEKHVDELTRSALGVLTGTKGLGEVKLRKKGGTYSLDNNDALMKRLGAQKISVKLRKSPMKISQK